MSTAALLNLKTTILDIDVNPNERPKGKVHLGDAAAVTFVATEECDLEFTGDDIFGEDYRKIHLVEGDNGPFDVLVDEGSCSCKVKKINRDVAGPQEIVVP